MTQAREILRDMLVTAGEQAAREAFLKYYEACRRPAIMDFGPPASETDKDVMWAARQALFEMDLHSRIWEIGRAVDFRLICERDRG